MLRILIRIDHLHRLLQCHVPETRSASIAFILSVLLVSAAASVPYWMGM